MYRVENFGKIKGSTEGFMHGISTINNNNNLGHR
jgi:hypothetical protein